MSSKRFTKSRFASLAALALCLPVGVAPFLAGSADAAVARDAAVHPGDLPTVSQAAATHPFLEDGSRELFRNRQLDVRTADCKGWNTGPRAASGRWASYLLADGSIPYFAGYADPGVFVYKFRTRLGAQAALAAERHSIRRCEGSASDPDGYKVTSHEVDVPSLGDARVANREIVRQPRSTGSDRDYFLSVWVRQGRYVIEVRAQKDAGPAGKDPVVGLAETTLATIG